MTRRRPGLLAITFPAMAGLILVAAPAVQADCAMPPPLREVVQTAPTVFVGTVIRLAEDDRWATVQVEEVWRGQIFTPTVEVRSGPPGPGMSSIDRTYVAGVRYLFPMDGQASPFEDSQCGSTTAWDPTLAELRPADAVTAPETVSTTETRTADLALVAGSVLSVVAVGVLVFGLALGIRRRQPG